MSCFGGILSFSNDSLPNGFVSTLFTSGCETSVLAPCNIQNLLHQTRVLLSFVFIYVFQRNVVTQQLGAKYYQYAEELLFTP